MTGRVLRSVLLLCAAALAHGEARGQGVFGSDGLSPAGEPVTGGYAVPLGWRQLLDEPSLVQPNDDQRLIPPDWRRLSDAKSFLQPNDGLDAMSPAWRRLSDERFLPQPNDGRSAAPPAWRRLSDAPSFLKPNDGWAFDADPSFDLQDLASKLLPRGEHDRPLGLIDGVWLRIVRADTSPKALIGIDANSCRAAQRFLGAPVTSAAFWRSDGPLQAGLNFDDDPSLVQEDERCVVNILRDDPDVIRLFSDLGWSEGVRGLNATPIELPRPPHTPMSSSELRACQEDPWSNLGICSQYIPFPEGWYKTYTPLEKLQPSWIRPERLREAQIQAVVDLALVMADGYGVSDDPHGGVTVDPGSGGMMGAGVRHFACSGTLAPDGTGIFTALHCIANLALSEGDIILTSRLHAQSGRVGCAKETKFRFVTGVMFYDGATQFSPKSVHRCASITRTAADTIFIELRRQQPLRPPLPSKGPIILGVGGSGLLTPGRRLYGLGMPHGLRVVQRSAGFLARNGQCVKSFPNGEKMSGEDQDRIGLGGLLCSSMDSYQGDSGGPAYAVTDDGGTLVLVGVMSGQRKMKEDQGLEEIKGHKFIKENGNTLYYDAEYSDLLDGPNTGFNTLSLISFSQR